MPDSLPSQLVLDLLDGVCRVVSELHEATGIVDVVFLGGGWEECGRGPSSSG